MTSSDMNMNTSNPATTDATSLPYAGVRVVEFTHMVMGPSIGVILGDLGADVIKVASGAGVFGSGVPPMVDAFEFAHHHSFGDVISFQLCKN